MVVVVEEEDELLRALSSAEDGLLDSLREDRARDAAAAIHAADYLLVATGAGMSAGAGMTVYRSYDRDGPSAASGTGIFRSGQEVTYEELASPEALTRTPMDFHTFMTRFYNAAAEARPSAAYYSLRDWQRRLGRDRAFTFTSNVDGLHLRAGCDHVLECHGSKMRWQCATPCTEQVWDIHGASSDFRFPEAFAPGDGDEARTVAAVAADSTSATASFMAVCGERRQPPTCPHCHGPARPAVLLFGSDGAALYERPTQVAAWRDWRRRVEDDLTANRGRKVAIIEVGAGTSVPSVRLACEGLLNALGPRQCTLIRINKTPITGDNSSPGVLMVKWSGEEAIACISTCLDELVQDQDASSDSEHETTQAKACVERGRSEPDAEAPPKRLRGDGTASGGGREV